MNLCVQVAEENRVQKLSKTENTWAKNLNTMHTGAEAITIRQDTNTEMKTQTKGKQPPTIHGTPNKRRVDTGSIGQENLEWLKMITMNTEYEQTHNLSKTQNRFKSNTEFWREI